MTLKQKDPAWINFGLPAPSKVVYQLAMEWDPRAECTGAPAPSIVPSVPTGPDYWCGVFFGDLLNGCNAAAGQDKWGGRLFVNCAIVSFIDSFFLFGLASPRLVSFTLPLHRRLWILVYRSPFAPPNIIEQKLIYTLIYAVRVGSLPSGLLLRRTRCPLARKPTRWQRWRRRHRRRQQQD